jgi:hypothetical protein
VLRNNATAEDVIPGSRYAPRGVCELQKIGQNCNATEKKTPFQQAPMNRDSQRGTYGSEQRQKVIDREILSTP